MLVLSNMDIWLFNRIVSISLWIVFIALILFIFMFSAHFVQKTIEAFTNNDIEDKGDKNDE